MRNVNDLRQAVPRYRHDALFHATDDDLLAAAVPFLKDGLDAGDTVVLTCDDPITDLLTTAVGDDPRFAYLPRADSYRRCVTAVAAYRAVVDRAVAEGAAQVRLVGDVDLGVPPDEQEWGRYEAVCNAALVALPVWSLCLYDTARLPASVTSTGRLTHPQLLDRHGRTPNPDYLEPAECLRRSHHNRAEPLEAQPAGVHRDNVQRDALDGLRNDVHRTMASSGASDDTIGGFVVALNEVVANALQHGRPPVAVDFWSGPDRSACLVADSGPGFDDPLTGYLLPARGTAGSRGLYLARQLCDRLSVGHEAGRFTVRMAVGH